MQLQTNKGNQNLFLHWGIFAEDFPEEILKNLHSDNSAEATIDIRRSYIYKDGKERAAIQRPERGAELKRKMAYTKMILERLKQYKRVELKFLG